ncbi:XRE family transcriptional regulator [Arthrobacter sp. BE255]|uniref:ImmA/IrrE family metallo-endopeptidase n=1 Tax=Arthrobacter sp. BE255 TaxID=2817721 RepID=UPI00285B8B79|nr:XRE family transcriptional regulator [Arthrobacter sp. BE255]MDR7161389.1 Zn-dependent peptidase ImmA (M78 family)/transcriptional regulator with XRE-family HTH domain [Arthrobacter sp. BE255]
MGNETQPVDAGARALQRIESLQMKHADVATAINMTPDALSRSLRGQRNFKLVEMAALADHLNTSIHWLVTGERDPYEVKLSARHQWDPGSRADHPHDWKTAKRVGNDVAGIYHQADVGPAGNPTTVGEGCTPNDAAQWAREYLVAGLPAGAVLADHLADVIERVFGIDVFVIDYDKEFDAYSAEANGAKFIVQKTTGAWWRAVFNVAHEFGHILHSDLAYSDEERMVRADEWWANNFAAELLLPETDMQAFDWAKGSVKDLGEFVVNHRVSTAAMANRVKSLGITPSATLSEALLWKTPRLLQAVHSPFWVAPLEDAYRSPRFPIRIIQAHQVAVAEGRANGQTLAWMLGVPVEDVDPAWSPRPSMTVERLLSAL